MSDFSLDDLYKSRINRFAAVIVAARRARKINQDFLAERESRAGEEEEIKEPRAADEALESLMKGKIEFEYPEVRTRKKG
ncbi:MAG: DNA-directed RNA polymerase subunit omega [candidate division Zixibacteria bacterium]|nr:DNA-directed RNA polymerase subunit omega [candidate division Zixibacteria bacterium]